MIWTEFINNNEYNKYFITSEEKWTNIFNEVKKYINENNTRPSCHSQNNNIKRLGAWIISQQCKYKTNKEIMKNEEIYNKWTEFINDPQYSKYFN